MKVFLVGMGMGRLDGLSGRAREALAGTDAIIGAERLLQALPPEASGERVSLVLPEQVAECICSRPEWQSACVALSGDPGFYSGARKLVELLRDHETEVLCGATTQQYFAALLKRPWQDFRLVSAHGVRSDVVAEVLNHPCVFFLIGGDFGAASIVRELCEAGLGEARVTVGENLSYPDERIVAGKAGDLCDARFGPLAVALVENSMTFSRPAGPAGIADGEFLRGVVPMTKREVRAVALSLMDLRPDSIVYDVGAGTGSVAVETALQARRGRVFAIECQQDACGLVTANKERFGAYNLRLVQGRAPEALTPLPPPDAAYIGGSRGGLEDIIAVLVGKNSAVRIVVGAVTLETLARAGEALRNHGVANIETVQVAVTRTRSAGNHTLFDAQNPVFLISGGGRG